MQTVSVAASDKLKESLDINSSVRCIAEWNHNRFSPIASITNGVFAEELELDNEVFPLSSIAEPERPTRGILKARTANRNEVPTNGADGFVTKGYADSVTGARYMTASVDSKYKYWTSPGESAGITPPFTISNVTPTVMYTNLVWTNKLYICFENSYAGPTAFTVSTTTDGTNWTVAATTPAINSKGQVELYRQANGTWSTTVYRDNPVQIRGVRVTVTEMNKGGVHFNLIEMGARIESDLSQFVVDYHVENTLSETSFAAPLGKASSNTGGVTLDNTDSRFTNDNPTSLYYNLLDKNVEFRLDVGINKGTMAVPDFEWFRQLTMRSESWNGQTPDTTDVELTDASEYLQSVNPAPFLYMDMTVGEIIWRILDSVGFSSWKYETIDADPATRIPQFWADGEKSVWEVIQDLAEATQTAIYFDEFGVFQIKTRSVAYNLANSPVWNLDGIKNGTKQPDIVELQKTYDYEANVVNVVYKPTSLSKANEYGRLPIMESVWEPEDTVALRSSQLKTSLTSNATNIAITPADATTWPYAGIMQIEGEFIRYDAKGYTYYNAGGTTTYTYIKSAEEKAAMDKANPLLAYKNYFNGNMRVPTGGRGIWNTTAKAHSVDIAGWTFNRYRTTSGAVVAWNGGIVHNVNESTLKMVTNKNFTPNTWYVATRGSSGDQIPYFYGTRVRFPTSGYTYGAAGLAISAGSNDAGYFVELVRTKAISATDRAKYTNELCFYVRYTNGSIKRLGPNGGKGVPLVISEGVWYDIDVRWSTISGGVQFDIAVNGVNRMSVPVMTAQSTGEAYGGRYGMFTRGFTVAEFEYIYATTTAVNDAFDQEGWFDRIKSGYQSGQFDREWVYSWRTATRIVKKRKQSYQQRYNSILMDEFGPIVHEVREYEVKFNKTPVLHSNLYFSNESQVICAEYNSNPFGAKFILANTSRDTAIVSGEDTLTFGADNPVEQRMMVYGRTFTQDEEKTVTVKDTQGIKRRGEVSLDIASEWIQTESAAKGLGDWVVKNWSGGADEVEVQLFGNPLLQLTDMVSVNYPAAHMSTATHKYFVTKVSHSYDNGLETQLTLRRAKI